MTSSAEEIETVPDLNSNVATNVLPGMIPSLKSCFESIKKYVFKVLNTVAETYLSIIVTN